MSEYDHTEACSTSLRLLDAEDQRNDRIQELLETIREQIRNDIAPEHRPEGLMTNIQNAVYAMRGRTRLMNNAAIILPMTRSELPTEEMVEAAAKEYADPEWFEIRRAFVDGANFVRAALKEEK